MSISTEHIANRYVALLIDTATNAGLDGKRLLQAAELDTQVLTELSGVTAVPKFFRLVDIIVGQEPAIGIEFGRILNISTSGKLGELLMSCGTLRDACLYACRFLPLVGLPISVEVDSVGDTMVAQLFLPGACYADTRFADSRFEHYCRAIRRRRFFTEFNLVSWLQHIQFLIRDNYCFHHIEFDFPAPEYAPAVQSVFGCPIRYDGDAIRISFAAKTLSRRLPSANPVIEKMQFNSCCLLLQKKRKNHTLAEQIRQLLLRNAHLLSLEQVASQFNRPVRNLRKQLQLENMPFRHILQSVKQRKACDFLRTGKNTVGEVARMLGYNDTANFRRAFRTWTGMSPSAYLKSHNVADTGGAVVDVVEFDAAADFQEISGAENTATNDFIPSVVSRRRENDRGKNPVSGWSIS